MKIQEASNIMVSPWMRSPTPGAALDDWWSSFSCELGCWSWCPPCSWTLTAFPWRSSNSIECLSRRVLSRSRRLCKIEINYEIVIFDTFCHRLTSINCEMVEIEVLVDMFLTISAMWTSLWSPSTIVSSEEADILTLFWTLRSGL